MRSILSTIQVTVYGVFLFLSLSGVATADTAQARADQSADRNRIGGQAGETIHSEQRTIGSRQLGGGRVGGQAGQHSDQEEPGSEAK